LFKNPKFLIVLLIVFCVGLIVFQRQEISKSFVIQQTQTRSPASVGLEEVIISQSDLIVQLNEGDLGYLGRLESLSDREEQDEQDELNEFENQTAFNPELNSLVPLNPNIALEGANYLRRLIDIERQKRESREQNNNNSKRFEEFGGREISNSDKENKSDEVNTGETQKEYSSGSSGGLSSRAVRGVIPALVNKIAFGNTTQGYKTLLLNQAWANSCQANVKIYKLNIDGSLPLEALAEVAVKPNGSFTFPESLTNQLPKKLEFQHLLMVESSGCDLSDTLSRFVTSITRSLVIDYSDTLISTLRLEPTAYQNRMNWDSEKYEALADDMRGEASVEATYLNKLIVSDQLSDRFQEFFLQSPATLPEFKPVVLGHGIPSSLVEKTGTQFWVNTNHWDSAYPLAIEWVWRGEVVSTEKTFVLTPDANSQGQHEMILRVGKNNGAGRVDQGQSFYEHRVMNTVQDASPVTAPNFEMISATPGYSLSTDLILRVQTGINQNACESFSNFAVTETEEIPTGDAFIFECDTDVQQDINYTLVDETEGERSLYIWSIDSSGNISTHRSLNFELYLTAPPAPLVTVTSSAITSTTEISVGFSQCIGINKIAIGLEADSSTILEERWIDCHVLPADYQFTIPATEGLQTVNVWQRDPAGNHSAPRALTVTYDETNPTLSLTTILNGAYQGGQSLDLDFTHSDTNGLSSLRLEYAEDGVNFSIVENLTVDAVSTELTLPAHNTSNARLRLIARDQAVPANQTIVVSNIFEIDSAAPNAPSITLASASINSLRTYSLNSANCTDTAFLLVSDSNTTPDINDVLWQTCSTVAGAIEGELPVASTQGSKTIYIFAKDSIGNISSSASQVSFIYDSVDPTLNFAETPSGAYRGGASLSFDFSASDTNDLSLLRLEYAANGVDYTVVESFAVSATEYEWTIPTDSTVLARVRLIAEDTAEPANQTIVTSASFEIDSTAPANPSINISSEAISSVRAYSLTAQNCTGATHLFVSSSLVTPDRDDLTWQACSTTVGAITGEISEGEADGQKNLYVFAKDGVGNISTSTLLNFIYDTTDPTLELDTVLTGVYRGGEVRELVFSGSDTNNLSSLLLQYSPDGTNFSDVVNLAVGAISYNWTLPSANTSSARLRLVAQDSAIPANETIITSGIFSIDSTAPLAPSIIIHTPSNTPAVSSVADLAFSVASCSDRPQLIVTNSLVAPSLDDEAWQACSTALGGLTHSLIAPVMEVSHQLYIYARDSVGNISPPELLSVIYDNTNPAFSMTTAIRTHYSGGEVHAFEFTSSDANQVKEIIVQYAPDGSTYSTLATLAGTTTNYNWSAPAVNLSGARLRLIINDNALPAKTTTYTSSAFTIDSLDPVLTITGPGVLSYHRSGLVLTGACETGLPVVFAGDLLESFQVNCNGGAFSQAISFSSGDGTKVLSVTQTDLALNQTSVNRSFIRDEIPPVLVRTSGQNPAFSNTNQMTWGGTCEGNYPITVAGDQSSVFNCNNGVWSFTNNAKTIDGSYQFTLSQTDAAGNTSSNLSLSWLRDATPPLFNASVPVSLVTGESKSFSSNNNSFTISGNCEGINPIVISGQVSTTISCSASSWSWTAPSVTTDGLRHYQFSQTDSAGNSSVIQLAWTRDTTGPQFYLATSTITKTNTNTQTFTGTCDNSFAVVISGHQNGSVACASGNWTWTTATETTDASRTYQFSQTNGLGTATSANATWVRGTQRPIITSFTTSSPSPTSIAFAEVDLVAESQNASVRLSHFCMLSNNDTQPLSNDSCWRYISSPLVGLPLSETLNLQDFSFLVGWTPETYAVRAWVKDEAGNISENSDQVDTDLFNFIYAPGTPPTVLDVIAANNDISTNPPSNLEAQVPAGTDVYIRWTATNSEGPLPAGAISLYYTQNERDFTEINGAQNLNNQNYGCPTVVLQANQGCFRWVGGSPLNTPFKIRVKALNASLLSDQSISTILNSSVIKILAGNTESGLGGSAQTAMFLTSKQDFGSDPNSLIVTNKGRFYFADFSRGILTINPETGRQEIFIPTTGMSSGDGGAAVNATLTYPTKIAMDFQNRLLIFDRNRIRRVDLNLSTPTIETIIGGGSNTSNTVNNPLDLQIHNHTDSGWPVKSMIFYAAPNGDIYFHSDYAIKNAGPTSWRIRIYKAATGQILSKYFTGDSTGADIGQDLLSCRLSGPGLRFNENSEITGVTSNVHYDASYAGCNTRNNYYSRAYYNPTTFVSSAATRLDNQHANYRSHSITGMNGQTYNIFLRRYVNRVNYDGTHTRILGTGTQGQCDDGTGPLSCNMDIQDIFVTPDEKIYFVDGGLIRTIDEDGLVKTLFGQRATFGDGVNAITSRFEQISFIGERDDERIIVADATGMLIKEFTIEDDIHIIAGNGANAQQVVPGLAIGNPISDPSWLTMDSSTGNIYARKTDGEGQIIVLDRSTGNWEYVLGPNPGGTQFLSADGLVGSALKTGSNQDRALPIGFGDSKLLVHRMRYNPVEIQEDNYTLKIYDEGDSYRQSHLAGGLADTGINTMCASGTLTANCKMPHWDRFISGGQWDDVTESWIVHNRATRAIYSLKQGANATLLATLPSQTDSGTIMIRESGQMIMYYCRSNGRIHKFNLSTQSEIGALDWPITGMNCRGRRLLYNSNRNTIIFPFEQNGLYGVAEYALP